MSYLSRQYNEENKRREALASPEYIAAKRPEEEEEEDTPDDVSTEGGILHEEHFHEIKMPGNKTVLTEFLRFEYLAVMA